ncbi:zinc ion binding protein-like protein [Bisporella sp. PMI_857]|nr:zinc ion binding protein-like protein [Bisporella sp. PMI_857]
MSEHDALIFEYSHLQRLPREKEALHALKKIASLVKPIMRARGWKVGTLAEFYPDQTNLLGLNENRGQRILLRLRYAGDQNQFLPLEQVVDTMLHELSHNVHGPHDAKFHALWEQLRSEYEGLLAKGYTGEGFLSQGHRLGGRTVPRDEARRIARAAAEKRRNLSAGSGQRLGGAPIRVGTDIREVIVSAIERRNKVTEGCGSQNKNDKEIKDLADQATQNGFRTKAEEDEANDRAIAQALWDLVQEDEKEEANKRGETYTRPSSSNPSGSQTQKLNRSEVAGSSSNQNWLQSTRQHETFIPAPERPQLNSTPAMTGWTCPICTLYNPIQYLACDACTIERPEEITKRLDEDARRRAVAKQRQTHNWQCHVCSTIMEEKWWTCSTCGTLKQSS